MIITANELIGMKELAVDPGADFVNHGWLQIDEHGPRHVLARSGLWNSKIESIWNETKTFQFL